MNDEVKIFISGDFCPAWGSVDQLIQDNAGTWRIVLK